MSPHARDVEDECARGECSKKAVIFIRDGRGYCKHHGDDLPSYQRRVARPATRRPRK